MRLARFGGLSAVRITTSWVPGRVRPTAWDFSRMQNTVDQPRSTASRSTFALPTRQPHDTEDEQGACAVRRLCRLARKRVPDGTPVRDRQRAEPEPVLDAAVPRQAGVSPAAYVSLLAKTYDALKRVSPLITVIGGALAPRGDDRPRSKRQTLADPIHPRDGQGLPAQQARPPDHGRVRAPPVPGDVAPATNRAAPRSTTISLADYPKLVRLLGRAFKGTSQRGAKLPIVYTEFGVQSRIPPDKEDVYTNLDVPHGSDAVSELLPARYYRQALAMAYCQPTVRAFLFFHLADEADLGRWQSGIYYADETPKSSLPAVRGSGDRGSRRHDRQLRLTARARSAR